MRAALLVCLAACTAGDLGPGSGSQSGATDAQIDGHTGPVWVDSSVGSGGGPFPGCRNMVSGVGNGEHNTGRNCMDGCHNHGFTLAGTVYTSPSNNTGYAGATITIIDAQNRMIDVVVQANGNFYTSQSIAFPALVMATSCPYGVMMNGQINSGACNTGACHAQSGGAAGQIHLP